MSWTTLDTQVNQADTANFDTRTHAIANTTAYTYYRLNITASNGDGILQLAELQLLAPGADANTDSDCHSEADGYFDPDSHSEPNSKTNSYADAESDGHSAIERPEFKQAASDPD